jgi:hypothetical protein
MGGWSGSSEEINGIIYNTWTKKDSYSEPVKHKLKFKLAL